MEPIGLHADHFHHLPAACDQFGQGLAISIGDWAWFGTDAFSEQRDDPGIERIGLGEPSRGTREIPDLAWVDDGKRQSGAHQGSCHSNLEPAGCLKYDQGRGKGTQIIDELFKACAIARDSKSPT